MIDIYTYIKIITKFKGEIYTMGNDENTYGRCHILSDWTDWDYSIHCDKAQIERQGRAFTYPFTITVHKKKKTATC